MKKKLEIESCAECPHSCYNWSVMQHPVTYCAHADRLIPDARKTIPDFCLLENVE